MVAALELKRFVQHGYNLHSAEPDLQSQHYYRHVPVPHFAASRPMQQEGPAVHEEMNRSVKILSDVRTELG